MDNYDSKYNRKGFNYRGMSAKAAVNAATKHKNTRNRAAANREYLRQERDKSNSRYNRFGNTTYHSTFNRKMTAKEFANFVKASSRPVPAAARPPPPPPPSAPKNTRPNYYNTLKVPKTATNRTIRLAYHKLALEKHPNKGGDEEEFKKIQAAYETLSNAAKRNEYNVAKGFKAAETTAWGGRRRTRRRRS